MAPNDSSNLERSGSSPMATACLLISTFALCGAIFLGLLEIGEIRGGEGSIGREDPATVEQRFSSALEKKAENALQAVRDEHGEAVVEEEDDLDLGDDEDELDFGDEDEEEMDEELEDEEEDSLDDL